jgi:ABC-type sugar transport system permease subunit
LTDVTSTPSPTSQTKHVRWLDIRENITGCLFVLPAFVIIGVFGIFPIGFAVYVSVHKWRISPGRYLGLDNYTKALGNLAYVTFFFVSVVLIYLGVKAFLRVRQETKEHGGRLWVWVLPALVVAGGVIGLLRFAVILFPGILGVADKVKGQERTQELFLHYLGEAWRAPEVQSALWFAIIVLAVGLVLFYLASRYLTRSVRSTAYFSAMISVFILLSGGIFLGWYTFSEIQRAYQVAAEAGESVAIWAQVITISAGFILLGLSWWLWKSAGRRSSNVETLLRITAAGALAVGAWVLIAELPQAIEGGDPNWWDGLQVTVFYSIGTVPLQLGISLVLATLLFQDIKAKGFYRLIYFLPYITPAVAAAAVFRTFFSGRPTAPINSLISYLGIKPQLWLDQPKGIIQMLSGNPDLAGWLAGPSLALVVIIIFNVWAYIGYDTVIFLAGLGGIPSELYEAASIDGAGRWAQFRNITIPLLSPTTYFLTLLAVIGTFKAFNHVWVLRSGAALGTVDTASIVIFTEFNRNTRYGYAASFSLVLLGVILVLTIINNRIAEERVFYG